MSSLIAQREKFVKKRDQAQKEFEKLKKNPEADQFDLRKLQSRIRSHTFNIRDVDNQINKETAEVNRQQQQQQQQQRSGVHITTLRKTLRRFNKKLQDAQHDLNQLKRAKADPTEIQRAQNRVYAHERNVEEWEFAVEAEEARVANSMEEKLGDFSWLNRMLVAFGFPPEPTAAKARVALKTKVFINIYDLEAGELHRNHQTYAAFLKDIRQRRLYFQLKKAKEGGHLKLFLKVVFRRN